MSSLMEYESAPNVRSAFAGTEDLNSQSASKMLSLSKELALPVNAIRPNLRDAEQEAILRRIEEDKGLSVWAGFKPENAAFTRDNYDLMLQANTSIRENNKYDVEDVGFFESIGVQYGIGQKQQQIPELIEQYNNTVDVDEKARIRQSLVDLDDIIAQEQAKVDEMFWLNPVNVVGQLPQIIDSLPYMLGGASGGALAGSVVPVLGTISGAGYGALAGSAVHSYNQEKAHFQWEMMKELDEGGNPIPEENIELFSSIYGGLSSAVEVVGLGAIGKALGVSQIIKGLGEKQAKQYLKEYAKGMIKDKGLQPLLLEIGKKGVAGALIEGSEEGIQQFLSNVSESLLKSDVAQEYNRSFAPVSLSEGVGESALLGAGVGFWLGGAGGLVKGAYDYDRQKKAEKFIAAQVNNHEAIEQLKASMPSEVTENYLNAQFKDSMGKNTYVPANALLELYQKDPSITEQLDIDPVYLAEQAEAGLNIPVKLSSAHARLDSEQFASFAQIMKVDEEGFNAIDVSEYEQRIEEDKNRIEEIAYAYEDEQNALDYELDALRASMTEAIYNSNMPDVENNLYIQTEVNGGVDKFVNDNIELARRQAERLAEESDGQFTASQFLAKINFGDAQKEIGLELEKESLLYDSTSDFYDSVIGRLDKQSLQRDYLQTARELEYIYGKKIWARRNKNTGESGLPLDMLADELANRQMLTDITSNPTDALIEKLKAGNNLWTKDNAHKLRRQRNSRKKSNAVQMDLFQGEQKPVVVSSADLGVDDSADLKAFIAKAKDVYSKFKTVSHPILGEIRFSGKGFKESKNTGADKRKWKMIPVLNNIIETAQYIPLTKAEKEEFIGKKIEDRKDNIKDFHWLENTVFLDGELLRVGVQIAEDDFGNLFYNLNQDLDAWNTKYKSSNGTPTQSTIGSKRGLQDVNTSNENTIDNTDDNVNLKIEDGNTLYQTDSALLSPNGKPSNLTPELYNTVRTDEFKAWFGDWENDPKNASKVVDENGEPLVVYHGTNKADIKKFKNSKRGYLGQSIYTTDKKNKAEKYTDYNIVYNLFSNIKNPVIITTDSPSQELLNVIYGNDNEYNKRLKKQAYETDIITKKDITKLNNLGYDGIIWDFGVDKEIAVFNPNQIKSIENQGTFSNESDNIYHQVSNDDTEFSSSIQKKNGSETPRGKISKVDDDTYIIDLFSGANLSTIVHELSHFFFVEMQGMERNGFASDKLKQDMQELRNWLGMQEGENFTIEETIGDTYEEKKALYVDRQERLARGFEQYLREGNAPVSNLNNVFGRFSRWLKSIYKHAMKLNVELTDEVKGVFDRMLATEAEIERSANKHSITQFTSAELQDLGIEEKDRAFFNSLPESTKQEAEELLNRVRRKARAQLIAKVIKEVNAQIDEIPVYNTINAIKKEGMKKEDVSFLMGEEFANILSKKIPSGIRKNSTGKSPQELAVIYGYESTKDFLNDIYNAENKTALRKRLVQERLDTADTDFNSDDMLFEAKSFAVQETKIAELLSKKLGAKKILYDKSIKTYAWATISKMPMREAMSVYKFMTSARSNYRKERDAIMRKQWDKALEYNTQARVNLAMAQEARLIEAQFEKMQKKINRFVKQKSAKPDARYFVNRLAYKIGMQKFNVVLAQDKNNQVIVDWAKDVGMEINASLFMEEALTQKQKNNVPTSWRTMPYADVVPYFEEMESVITLEKNERQVRIGKERYDLNEYATKIADSIFKNVPTNNISQTEQTDAKKSFIKNFSASLLKADTITRLLDGDMLGIVWEALYKPINGATHNFNFRMEDVQKNLQELFSSYGADELKKMRKDKYIIKAFSENDSLTKEQIICFALNVGNESNLERLKNSYSSIGKEVNEKGELTGRLTDEQIEAVLATLDAKDWAFVQNVWDYFETFQKESFAQEERIQGVQPTKIEAKPFKTKYGEMRGGYFPTVYDTSKSGKSPQGIDISDTSKAQFNLPSVPHGSMKERKGDGLKIPLKLSFDVITNSITQTVHNLAFREPVREVSKLLRHPKVEDAIRKTAGIEQYKALQNWLVDVAGGTPTDFSGINKFANWARTTQSVMSMGYKLSTMLLQTVGSMHAIPELGAKNVGIGITHTLANMGRLGSFIDEVSAKSEIMKYRVQSIDRDVADFNRKITHSGNKYLQFIKQNAFTPMGYVQLVTVDLPVWWGAYQKGLKDHNGNEAKATQYADNIVEITQGSGQMKDLAGVQRGSELQKLFTMYYTFFSAVHQMAYRKITMLKRASKGERMTRTFALANYLVVGIVLQNVLSELMAGRGPEDDEGYAEWIAKSNITFAVGGIPVLRDVANGLLGDYGYSITPASTGLETIVNASRNLFLVGLGEKELDTKKTAINTAKALGFATGSPLFGNQMTNSLREFFDYLDGTDPEFEAWRILMGVKND